MRTLIFSLVIFLLLSYYYIVHFVIEIEEDISLTTVSTDSISSSKNTNKINVVSKETLPKVDHTSTSPKDNEIPTPPLEPYFIKHYDNLPPITSENIKDVHKRLKTRSAEDLLNYYTVEDVYYGLYLSNITSKWAINEENSNYYIDPPIFSFMPTQGFERIIDLNKKLPDESQSDFGFTDNKKYMLSNYYKNIFKDNKTYQDLIERHKQGEYVSEEFNELVLSNHPIRKLTTKGNDIISVLRSIKNSKYCKNIPVTITMTTYTDRYYWELSENFVYSMIQFENSECSLIICIDDKCNQKCEENNLPCYFFQLEDKSIPIMVLIGYLKLEIFPQILNEGIDLLILDIDIGLRSYLTPIFNRFNQDKHVNIYFQKDITLVNNVTTKEFIHKPLSNIGITLARGNEINYNMFRYANLKFLSLPTTNKKYNSVGTDQAFVDYSAKVFRHFLNSKYAYIDVPAAILIDKISTLHKIFVSQLGGDIASKVIEEDLWYYYEKQKDNQFNLPSTNIKSFKPIFMHATCHEKNTKILGLKSVGANWNHKYYNPNQRTITKFLIYYSRVQLVNEIKSLYWLGQKLNRSVIIPNILLPPAFKHNFQVDENNYWPGFRTVKLPPDNKNITINTLEPSFYWRINQDYHPGYIKPYFYKLNKNSAKDLNKIYSDLKNLDNENRIVIDPLVPFISEWADSPTSLVPVNYGAVTKSYIQLDQNFKFLDDTLSRFLDSNIRICRNFLNFDNTSKVCFRICQ